MNNLNYEEAHRITTEIHLEVLEVLTITYHMCMYDKIETRVRSNAIMLLLNYSCPQLLETRALTSVNLFLLLDKIFCYNFYTLYRLITRFEISD